MSPPISDEHQTTSISLHSCLQLQTLADITPLSLESCTTWRFSKRWPSSDGDSEYVSSPCLSAGMSPIPQDKRVSMGLNGDLYFSNVLAKDSQTDYSCNARFLFTHTIQQKNPFTLKVQTSEWRTIFSFFNCLKQGNMSPSSGRKMLELNFSNLRWHCVTVFACFQRSSIMTPLTIPLSLLVVSLAVSWPLS